MGSHGTRAEDPHCHLQAKRQHLSSKRRVLPEVMSSSRAALHPWFTSWKKPQLLQAAAIASATSAGGRRPLFSGARNCCASITGGPAA